jgi:hypothetical protein
MLFGRVEFPTAMDYGWLAVDVTGSVALFTNAGAGPIPLGVIEARPAADEAESLVLALAPSSSAEVLGHEAFAQFAERGLFSYDWEDVHRTRGKTNRYELQARPAIPLPESKLPPELAQLAALVRLEDVEFAGADSIDITAHVECRLPPW